MRIISWNVNGIRAVQKKGFLDWLSKEGPDILCLQETKAAPEQLESQLLNPVGYQSYWAAAEKKGYSGVAIYTKLVPLNIKCGFGEKKYDSEGRVLIAEYSEFILLNIYFPNGKKDAQRLRYKMDFYEYTLAYCEELRLSGKKVIVCGDVNTAHQPIDLAHPKENEDVSGFLPIERQWIDKFLAAGYIDTLRHFNPEPHLYSWWDYKTKARERNIGWRIDYFFVSQDLLPKLKNAFILDQIYGSDHCPIGIEMEF